MRALLIGQAPSSTSNPSRPFSGKSGARICALLGIDDITDAFDVANLLDAYPGRAAIKGDRFNVHEARAAARQLVHHMHGRPVVLVGNNVADAFKLRGLEPLRWSNRVVFNERDAPSPVMVALLPHPSGLNHWWNDRANVASARRFLTRIAP